MSKTIQRVPQANCRSGLAFPGRGRADGGDQHQLAIRPVFDAFDVLQRQFRFVTAVRVEMFLAYPQPFLGQPDDGFHRGLLGDFNVGHGCS